jgi:hypothetical protein
VCVNTLYYTTYTTQQLCTAEGFDRYDQDKDGQISYAELTVVHVCVVCVSCRVCVVL